VVRFLALVVVLLFDLAGASTQPEHMPANELVRQIVANELKAENQDHSHWKFRLRTEKPGSPSEVDEVVETKAGDLQFPVSIDDRQVNASEKQRAEERIEQVKRDPAALKESLKDKSEDSNRSQHMLQMLPDAFIFSYGKREGELVQLDFRPKADFRPATREDEVFHAMAGTLSVDVKKQRIARISGHLIQEVKFAGGLLGHLDKGGIFDVKQEEVSPGYWELTVLNVQMTGRVLFFKTIAVHQQCSRSNFQRVPDNLTVAQAAEMLHNAEQIALFSRQHGRI